MCTMNVFRNVVFLLLLITGLLYLGCSTQKTTGELSSPKSEGAPGESVKIAGLEPSLGGRGATVIINGFGFSEDPAQLLVQFGATRAVIKNSGSKVVVAVVPPSIMDGKYKVSITNTKLNRTSNTAEFQVHGDAQAMTAASPTVGTSAGAGSAAAETRKAPITVPTGTPLKVRSVDAIRSDKNSVGDTFELTLDEPLVINGQTVARKGSQVVGRITQAKGSGRVKGRARLGFTLVSLKPGGQSQSYAIQTNQVAKEAPGTKKRDAAIIGGGAGVGAAIGAIAGGGKGAAIGAAVGGGGGTGAVLATKGKEVVYPPETSFTLKLRAPLTIP
ncbi:MAG: IPT/TIG domain-containing protein [Acidobacteria bacterium]|nr:IPT/TIG domain-containing protein [Acidobacteriota bacterium]MBI3656946.1 IPT/TIG domain-containing protein [Acidobacteriota bacterium]